MAEKNAPAGQDKGKPMTAADHRRWRAGMSRWHRETDKRAEQYGCFDPFDDCC